MSKLCVVMRHCEPEGAGRLLGWSDSPLSAAGLRHAAGLQSDAAVIWSSPLLRARQTAETLRGDAPRRVLAELREVSMGEWDGLLWNEIEERDPELARRKLSDWLTVTPPGGETWPGFLQRVEQALRVVREGPRPALVVCHLSVAAAFAYFLRGADPIAYRLGYGETVEYEL